MPEPMDVMKNYKEFPDSMSLKKYIKKDGGTVFIPTQDGQIPVGLVEYNKLLAGEDWGNVTEQTRKELFTTINITIDRVNTLRAAIQSPGLAKVNGYMIDENLFKILKDEIKKEDSKGYMSNNKIYFPRQTIEDILITLKHPSERQQWIDDFELFVEKVETLTSKEQMSGEMEQEARCFQSIEKFFPKSLDLPEMIGTNYFQGFSTEQFTQRENRVVQLHDRLTTARVQLPKENYKGADHD